jgi:hypothetical protein
MLHKKHGVLRTIALTDPRHGAPLWLLIRPSQRPQRPLA